MSSFLSKIIDSSASLVSSRGGRRVSDARGSSEGSRFSVKELEDLLRKFGFSVSFEDDGVWSSIRQLDGSTYDYSSSDSRQDSIVGFQFYGGYDTKEDPYSILPSRIPVSSLSLRILVGSDVIDEFRFEDGDYEVDYVRVSDLAGSISSAISRRLSAYDALVFISDKCPWLRLVPSELIHEISEAAGSDNQPSHGKVSDSNSSARGRLATYATLAEALHSNGIDYSLDDYRIWSANIPLDDHGRNSNTFIQVYGDGFEGYASEDEAMDALGVFYDENGRDAFYDSITLTSLCIRVHDGENTPLLEWYVDSTSLRSSFVVGVIDAIGFCSEEHMSVAEFFDYMSKFVNLDTNYFIGEEEFEQKYLVYDSKAVSDDAKIARKCTPRRAQDSEDLDGWVKRDGGRKWDAIYRKEYDDIPPMRIFVREESPGYYAYHIDPYLLSALKFEDVADILRINVFNSLSDAAAVADRIAAAYSRFHKSLFGVIRGW